MGLAGGDPAWNGPRRRGPASVPSGGATGGRAGASPLVSPLPWAYGSITTHGDVWTQPVVRHSLWACTRCHTVAAGRSRGHIAEWSFLSNHARVLVCIADDPGVRLRDIASMLGITERVHSASSPT